MTKPKRMKFSLFKLMFVGLFIVAVSGTLTHLLDLLTSVMSYESWTIASRSKQCIEYKQLSFVSPRIHGISWLHSNIYSMIVMCVCVIRRFIKTHLEIPAFPMLQPSTLVWTVLSVDRFSISSEVVYRLPISLL